MSSMASSSTAKGSSASSSSSSFDSSGIQWEYEVFLSFRGEDTRNNFTDHLYTALNDRGIYTFRDDERLERGKEISSELLEAIERSRFSIIVLSKNYASSTWCLEELAKILECMATKKQKVFPVFYDVDPSDVRKQRGDFEAAFHEHEEDYKDNLDKVHRWRSALTRVGNLSGWHLEENRSEAEYIKRIVDTISMSLKPTFSEVVEDLVGIKSRLKEINDLLESGLDDIRFIGIFGMGGIGKTTIASVLYKRFSGDYQGSCFLADVREVSSKKSVVHLQEMLLSKVVNETSLNICHPDEGIDYIKRRLCHKRVFVVLDDVDQLKQLEKLAGEDNWFGSGSRIIITTRDKHVLTSHGISSIYEVKGMKDDDALQLFHMKAFRQGQPTDDHVELSKQIVRYTNGLPLALKVLGSHLCARSVKVWESGLNRLKIGPPKEILDILRISYDGLDETDKQIFLDIACFFRGKNKDRVVEILDSCYFGSSAFGIEALNDKSLITVSYNKLGMHDLLQQMVWEIVREKHCEDRGQWSRLWLFEDIHNVLIENKGTQEVKGIMLDKYGHRITLLNGRSFSNMRNLRLLKIRNVDLSEDIEYLSNELRFLKWPEYPSNSLPSNFRPEELFELNLCRSWIKYLWKDRKEFQKLKTVKLNYSHNLIETPDFTMVPNLEMLDFEGCTRLCKVHESVGGLKRLTILNLKGCKNLVSFPSNVSGLKLLKILNLQDCSKLDKLPQNLGELESLEDLDLRGIAIRQVPSSIGRLTILNLKGCKNLESFPSNLSGLKLIKILNLQGCSKLEKLPQNLGELEFLEDLDLGGTAVRQVPSSFARLTILNLKGCKNLESFPSNLSGLKLIKILNLQGCSKLEKLPQNLGELEFLEDLDLGGTAVRQVPSSFARLTILNLKGCKNLESFPSNLSGLKLIKILNLQGCSKLEKLPQNLGELECLEDLDLGGTAIRQVPSSIARLTNLKNLSFRECKGQPPRSWISLFFSSLLPRRPPNSMCLLLPPLSGLCSLKTLDLSDCGLLEGTLPNDISSLYSLKELKLSNNNFFSLPESIKELSKLKILCLENCRWLQSLPELPPNTIFVGAEDCHSLKDVSGALRGGTSKNFALHLFNCFKLLENQDQESSLAVMLLKQYLQQWVNRFSHQFHIPLPGSEIPKWFSCRCDGDSVAIELRPNWLNDEFIGIAMCGVYAPNPEDLNNDIRRMSFEISIMRNDYFFTFDIPSFIAVKSDHLYLTFVSRVKFEHGYSYTITGDDTGSAYVSPRSGTHYELVSRSTCIHARFGYGSKSKVIRCGIRLVYKQDIEDFQELPAAEGSTFHQNHNCSLAERRGSCWLHFPVPTKLGYECNTSGNYSGYVLDADFGRSEYSDSDEEPELAEQRHQLFRGI